MRCHIGKLLQLLIAPLQLFHGFFQFFLGQLALGNVADDGRNHYSSLNFERA